MRILFTGLLFAVAGPAMALQSHPATHFFMGGLIPFTYNTSWSQTSSTDLRLGAGLAARAEFQFGRLPLAIIASLSKSQLLTQRIAGEKNTALCREQANWGDTLVSFPGPCTLYTTRLALLYRLGPWEFGLSGIYNYTTDLTFSGSRIYNTRWASEGFGAMAGYHYTLGRFSLGLYANFDYLPFSQTLAGQPIKATQAGASIYAMFRIF